MMNTDTIIAMWEALQTRFHKLVKELPSEALALAIGPASVGHMIRHSAEVEFVYAEWVFGVKKPDDVEYHTLRGPSHAKIEFTELDELVALLERSNETLIGAMRSLPESDWTKEVKTPRGTFSALDAISQLMYHTGIHAGQISLMQKHA